jgi:hypothetical protein
MTNPRSAVESGKRILDIAVHDLNVTADEHRDLGALQLKFLNGCWSSGDFAEGLKHLLHSRCIELPTETSFTITKSGRDLVRMAQ